MRLSILFLLLAFCSTISGQTAPFSKGVNLTSWFQVGAAKEIQFTKYTKQDFENIQSLGCDVIRLPINLHFMTDGAPNYTLDPLFLNFLDQAVDWAEELGIYLILDNHTFDPAEATDPAIGDVLVKVWEQMATHFKDRSTLLMYEVLNEPHGISDQLWNSIQQEVVEVIRTVDEKHTIVVGPASWNSYTNLSLMPIYEDENLLYTFHFYDPFIFTHQGASWVSPSMVPLADVPFPYSADNMPTFPPSLNGTWIQWNFINYNIDGTISKIKELIDIAVDFQQNRNVPIYCGEFGVYIPNSKQPDRVFWYDQVRQYLEEKDIAWTTWDYHGGFGLFEANGNGLFQHDLNADLLTALGMDVPEQLPFEIKPDSSGFFIYSDFIGERIESVSYSPGELDFYNQLAPNNDAYSLFWTGANQYQSISLDFRPDRDLSYLVEQDFALDFFVKGDTPGTSFDIRFVDSETDIPEDLPWRIRVTIDDEVSWDNTWQHVHIKLSDFVEHGAWNGTWHNPIGAFDWSKINLVEIVAEQGALGDARLWFDNIQITDIDPTEVNAVKDHKRLFPVQIFPNPAKDNLFLKSEFPAPLNYQLRDAFGRVLHGGNLLGREELDLSIYPAGYYFLKLYDERGAFEVRKIIKP
ncbi:MAG: cellulase family glycosylhydrolase [Saprospiraceae bacterium]|nr:cellulase family glycosylhydrolase [Saprospiraceae bacterium]